MLFNLIHGLALVIGYCSLAYMAWVFCVALIEAIIFSVGTLWMDIYSCWWAGSLRSAKWWKIPWFFVGRIASRMFGQMASIRGLSSEYMTYKPPFKFIKRGEKRL